MSAQTPAGPQAGYLHGHHESVLRSHRSRTAESSAAYLLAHLRPGQRVLDVGCGPGTITADLARIVAPGRVTAIDSSAEAVDQARRHLRAEGIVTVEVHLADLYSIEEALEHPDGSFDVVHAHQVLQHVPDPVGALRRLGRLCAPGGVVAARDADYAAMTWYPLLPELERWQRLYRGLARAAGGEPDAGRRLLSWAREAGFADVTAGASTWCYATASARAWWGGMWADRILESAIARSALAGGAATMADLHEISDAWRRWAAADDGWFAVLHGEVICRT